jgi:hypothetical protein
VASAWLARHGLVDTGPTPALAAPGWRALVGVPYVVFTGASVAGALALTLGALTVDDPQVRYAAVALLIGLGGVTAGIAVRIRHLLTRPVVAEDVESLTADVVMRIEDAREASAPTVLWSLPMVVLFGTAPAWWNVASLALVAGGLVALVAIQMRTPGVGAAARRAMATQ